MDVQGLLQCVDPIPEGYLYAQYWMRIESDCLTPVNRLRLLNESRLLQVFKRTENPDFVATVEKSFPDKDEAKILIGCSDGRRYSMDALMALDEAGYSNIVGLKGGYYAWAQTFDNKGKRRVFGEYQEDYLKGGDSAGAVLLAYRDPVQSHNAWHNLPLWLHPSA